MLVAATAGGASKADEVNKEGRILPEELMKNGEYLHFGGYLAVQIN